LAATISVAFPDLIPWLAAAAVDGRGGTARGSVPRVTVVGSCARKRSRYAWMLARRTVTDAASIAVDAIGSPPGADQELREALVTCVLRWSNGLTIIREV